MQLAAEIAQAHHESWDGRGYYGQVSEDIPLASRIVTVADAFDALTHDRPYRPATTIQKAMEELRGEAGRQFDPQLVAALSGPLERHPAIHYETSQA